MSISKRRKLQVLALILGLMTLATGVYAASWMTREITMSGGIEATGSIQLFKDAALTQPLNSHDYTLFSGVAPQSQSVDVYIKNTGSVAVYVYWFTDSSWTLRASENGYERTVSGNTFRHICYDPSDTIMNPMNASTPGSVTVPFGGSVKCRLVFEWFSGTGQACSFNWVTTFSAEDA